jgi:hypothetical protein
MQTSPASYTSILSATTGSGIEKIRGASCYQIPAKGARKVSPANAEKFD